MFADNKAMLVPGTQVKHNPSLPRRSTDTDRKPQLVQVRKAKEGYITYPSTHFYLKSSHLS